MTPYEQYYWFETLCEPITVDLRIAATVLNVKGVRLRVTRIKLHLLGLNSIHQSDSRFSKL